MHIGKCKIRELCILIQKPRASKTGRQQSVGMRGTTRCNITLLFLHPSSTAAACLHEVHMCGHVDLQERSHNTHI